MYSWNSHLCGNTGSCHSIHGQKLHHSQRCSGSLHRSNSVYGRDVEDACFVCPCCQERHELHKCLAAISLAVVWAVLDSVNFNVSAWTKSHTHATIVQWHLNWLVTGAQATSIPQKLYTFNVRNTIITMVYIHLRNFIFSIAVIVWCLGKDVMTFWYIHASCLLFYVFVVAIINCWTRGEL